MSVVQNKRTLQKFSTVDVKYSLCQTTPEFSIEVYPTNHSNLGNCQHYFCFKEKKQTNYR